MIHFRCNDCGTDFKVDDIHAGRRTQCPKCDQTIQVPKSTTLVAPSTAQHSEKVLTITGASQIIGISPQASMDDIRQAYYEKAEHFYPIMAILRQHGNSYFSLLHSNYYKESMIHMGNCLLPLKMLGNIVCKFSDGKISDQIFSE